MIPQSVLTLVLTASLLPAPPARPLATAVATQAQAMDARLQQRTAEPAAATPREGRWSRLSRGKKVAIVVGIVAGVAIAVAALGNDSNDSGSGGGGY